MKSLIKLLHASSSVSKDEKVFSIVFQKVMRGIMHIFVTFQDNVKGPGIGHTDIDKDLDVQNYVQIQVPERLHPYSKYKLSVKALPNYRTKRRLRPEEKELKNVETKQGTVRS